MICPIPQKTSVALSNSASESGDRVKASKKRGVDQYKDGKEIHTVGSAAQTGENLRQEGGM